MERALLDRTYDLLDRTQLPPDRIADRAQVGKEWLKKLKARKIPDPSVNRVQRVHDLLIASADSLDQSGTEPRPHPEHSAPALAGS